MNIISVATWNRRFSTIGQYLDNFSEDFYNRYHVILNMTVEDFEIFPKAVYNKYKYKVEFLTTEINYGSTNKLLPMLKYKNDPIMILDDDNLYYENIINEYWKKYNKDCINGFDGSIVNSSQPFLLWYRIQRSGCYRSTNKNPYKATTLFFDLLEKPRKDLFFYGYAGLIFPPNILKIEDVDIQKEWKTFKQADDEWVFKRSLDLNINKYAVKLSGYIVKQNLTESGAVSSFDINYYEKCKKLHSIIYPLCKDFENNFILTVCACKSAIPCSKRSVKLTKGKGKYGIYVDFCNYFGFENVWDKYMPESKRRKMMILLHKEDTVIDDFLE
jgi:hypothetical protein